jgi:hypothetical protein
MMCLTGLARTLYLDTYFWARTAVASFETDIQLRHDTHYITLSLHHNTNFPPPHTLKTPT